MAVNVHSEMTGIVWKIEVTVGQKVSKNQDLIIIESMKMEIPVVSPEEGTIKEILVKEEDFVSEGDVLIVLD